jgi:two-component system response regulator DevR
MSEIRVMLVDDHEIVRQGLRALLDRREHLQVVAEAGSAAEAVEAAARVKPDVIVMDVRMPDGTGIEACREIRAERPETRVLMLTSYADDEAVYASIIAGAAGYLLKQTRGKELVSAIEAVARGESLLDPTLMGTVLNRMRELASGGHKDKLSELSDQERRILGLIAEGKTNREIAGTVYLSEKTVKNYVSTILSKLGMERRAQAAAYLADQRARGHE